MSFPENNEAYATCLLAEARQRTLDGWELPHSGSTTSAPSKIRKVGVIGAGVMGSGIAQWCAACGYEVVLRDMQPEFLERGMDVMRGIFAGSVKREKCTEQESEASLASITTTTAWDGFAECDVVIEAIVEDVAVKQTLFHELAGIVRPDALLVSNTSALPLEEVARGVSHPERVLGLHFFNPVGRMPLVELIVGKATSAETALRGLNFVKGLKKSSVICRSSPGFLVTRVLFFYLNEACRLREEGVATESIDAAMHRWGWPMGPMRLIDEVGVDVTAFIFGELAHYFPDRFQRSGICTRLLGLELKGRKNGASSGFYVYEGRESAVNTQIAELQPESTDLADAESIQARLMGVMIAEARRCLDEGVVQAPEDVDFALLSGAGFPPARGGLMRWASEEGLR